MTTRLFIALVLIGLVGAQTVVVQPAQFNYVVQMVPGTIPTSNTCIVGFASTCISKLTNSSPGTPTSPNDPFLCAADFTATGQTITLQDANSTPWVVGGAVLGSSGSPVGWTWIANSDSTCRRFPGGVYVIAGGAGVTGSLTIKYNR